MATKTNQLNSPLVIFNAGVVDTTALARSDQDFAAFAAERMDNWLPKVQGPMRIRPGTKYTGSTLNDTGAVFVEFVAAIDEVALLELTDRKMRIWNGTDAHNLSLLGRPNISTVVALTDTGWYDDNIGGGTRASGAAGEIPVMTGATTNGITLSASSEDGADRAAWKVADSDLGNNSYWLMDGDTGWIMVDFGTARKIEKVKIQSNTTHEEFAPENFLIQGNHADTGDLASWTTEQTIVGAPSWGETEWRTYTDTGYSDTGGNSWRYWRVYITESGEEDQNVIAGLQMLSGTPTDTGQVVFSGVGLSLNAGATGSLARTKKAVAVVDTGDSNKEHSLDINVTSGPVSLRVGSLDGADDLISETSLGEGYHNLAFIPSSFPFYITLQTSGAADRSVAKCSIGDSGTVELVSPWTTDTGVHGSTSHRSTDLQNLRYDQSQDVVFVAAAGLQQYKIERRGNGASVGRSWSAVKYYPKLGPFRANLDQNVELGVNGYFGTVDLTSNIPFFKSGHVGSLFRLTHDGQSTTEKLGFTNASTVAVSVSGLSESDTGLIDNFSANNERRISFSMTGTYVGTVSIERSFESKDYGFSQVAADYLTSASSASDTGTFTTIIHDKDDNATVYYRAVLTSWTSGTVSVAISAKRSVRSGIFRVLSVLNNKAATAEVIRAPSSTALTGDWQEGAWSDYRGFPSSVALHEGRLSYAGIGALWLSVSDDYENFDDEIVGDSKPIVRTFGSGPVDKIYYLVSMQSLLAGSADAELSVRASIQDEVLTPSNASAKRMSSQGAANIRPIKRDQDILFVQRSKKRLYRISQKDGNSAAETQELTLYVPRILNSGVVSVAIQRQPETRMHFVLADGTVALFAYDPIIGSFAWSKWVGDTGTSAVVEQVSVLPAIEEDAVFYLVKRTIGGATKRYIEKWAKETESVGDTGLSYLADCSKSYTDTGRNASITGFQHLGGANVVVWADDTGQAKAGKDLSPDTPTGQTEYAVGTGGATDTGEITLSEAVHHAVAGLPYKAVWKSSKITFDASSTVYGTGLGQMKRPTQIALILYETHNNGLFFGNDTGYLDALPRKSDEGAAVDADKIFHTLDMAAMPFPGLWDEDNRIVLVAKSPRPATVMAAIPSTILNEK